MEVFARAARLPIPFVKMQGVGNDFVVVGEDALAETTAEALSIALCERRFGVGADGLLIIGAPKHSLAAYSFAMHNPDGTPDMCGNGMRCAALYAHHVGLVPSLETEFLVDTQDGLLACRILSLAESRLSARVQVQMAVPHLTAGAVPFLGIAKHERVIDFPLQAGDTVLPVTAVNTGSTHSVAFRYALPQDDEFFAVSPLVEYHRHFPERTSLIWTQQIGASEFAVRIWERGAGETLGCGTGACAAAVAAIVTGRSTHGERISVASRGGVVEIDWPSLESSVTLTGPAVWVFSGTAALPVPEH